MTTEPRVLGGRYEIGALLGYGGMAEVRRGRDVRLGRDVAVKMLRTDLARDPSFQHRFRREAQSAASLNHPSIVAVYDTGEERGDGSTQPYIVMEYVDGRTLRDVLREEGPLPAERALGIVAAVLGALDYSHQHGIVHRDIKPANVMLTPAGAVKVMDFGIARALTATSATMTQTAAVIGTAQYLSPEQARGEAVDTRSDIYSTGCLLFELLTGRPPFTGESPVSVAYQHVREDPRPPSELVPELPPAVDAVTLTALAKQPSDRYQSAADMRADVERALAGQPVVASVPPPGGHATDETTVAAVPPAPPRRGRRALAYALLALAAIGVFVAAVVITKSLLTAGGSTRVYTPDVRGKTPADAQHLLARQGLRSRQTGETFSTTVPAGRVAKQSPAPDTPLHKGDEVDLVLSKGVQMVTVPPLQGLSKDNAVTTLHNAHLAVGDVRQVNPTEGQPAGTVLDSDPAQGASVSAGTKITLMVSNGYHPVPNVVGDPLQQAQQRLERAGFGNAISVVHHPGEGTNVVVGQSPTGQGYAAPGSRVTIVVNVEPTPTPTPSASAGASASASPSPSASPPPPPSAAPSP